MVEDILLDETGDLAVSADGDLVVGFSDYKHFEDIVMSAQGDWKQNPLIGVEAKQYINAPLTAATSADFKRRAKVQLEADGASGVDIQTGKEWVVKIDGEYL